MENRETPILKIQKPIDHLSYSAIRSFFRSPAKFQKEYIEKQPFQPNLTMEEGKAWHKGLELYYKRDPDYVAKGVATLASSYSELVKYVPVEEAEDFIKEFEKATKDLERNLLSYNAPLKKDYEYLLETKAVSTEVPGLPIVGVMDKLDEHGCPVDYKYVANFTKGKLFKHYVQAWFYYYLAKSVTGAYPQYCIISEFKKTLNRDKSPQLQESAIIYGQDFEIAKIDKWYEQVSQQIVNQKEFYPNPFQDYGGEDWIEYITQK